MPPKGEVPITVFYISLRSAYSCKVCTHKALFYIIQLTHQTSIRIDSGRLSYNSVMDTPNSVMI